MDVYAILFEILRYVTLGYNKARALWHWLVQFHLAPMAPARPTRLYFLSDSHSYDPSYERVPEDTVYVEEWLRADGVKKCRVLYEGDLIPRTWDKTPFEVEPKCPWIWVGDRDTEIDLTRTFDRFCVVGNKITLDLVLKLIQITEETNLVYIEPKTLNEHKFPGEGIVIEPYA